VAYGLIHGIAAVGSPTLFYLPYFSYLYLLSTEKYHHLHTYSVKLGPLGVASQGEHPATHLSGRHIQVKGSIKTVEG
jgi:hypothetical protein